MRTKTTSVKNTKNFLKPSITCTQFVDHLVVKDLTFSVTTDSNGATGLDKLKTLESKVNDLTSLFKSNEVNAIDTSRPRDPNLKGRPNSTMCSDYCRNNGHSVSRCTEKQIDDNVNKLRKELVEPRRIIERITEATQDLVVLETNAINQEKVTQTITLGSTSLTINSKIHL